MILEPPGMSRFEAKEVLLLKLLNMKVPFYMHVTVYGTGRAEQG